jgi:ribonuclease HII
MTRPTRRIENKLHRQGYRLVAGTDEAGRGAWAGPLVAAAVVLPLRYSLRGLNDSKKLNEKQREALYEKIVIQSVCWSITIIEVGEIDSKGIGPMNIAALKRSVERLSKKPHYVLVDAFNFVFGSTPVRGIIRGDAKVTAIAAASIVAKVTRDRIMRQHHRRYPQYLFHRHKGYGTKEHFRRIKKYGLTPLHRRSFEPMKTLVS